MSYCRSPIRSLFVKSGTFGILATVSVRVARAIRGSNVKQRNLVISPQTPATPVNTSGTLKTPVQTGSTGLTPRKTETLWKCSAIWRPTEVPHVKSMWEKRLTQDGHTSAVARPSSYACAQPDSCSCRQLFRPCRRQKLCGHSPLSEPLTAKWQLHRDSKP